MFGLRARGLRFAASASLVAGAAAAFGACSRGDPPAAHLGLVMEAPEGLLDQAIKVSLDVFDPGQARCNADGSAPKGVGAVQHFDLAQIGCPRGDSWCETISLDLDGSTKMFSVVAESAAGKLAQGCATAKIDQDPVAVDIKVQRFIEPKCCNDGQVQVGEQCDTGMRADPSCDGSAAMSCGGITADAVCDCSCNAQEILLSIDGAQPPNLTNGAPGTKSHVVMTFAPGNGDVGEALRAVYVDTDPATKGGSDLNERFLRSDLYPFVGVPVALDEQLLLPVYCADPTTRATNGFVQHQQSPAIAAVGDETLIVYASDENQGGNFDIFVIPQTRDGCDDTHICQTSADCTAPATCITSSGFCSPQEQLNVTGTVPGASDPAVAAGAPDTALVVWTSGTEVLARLRQTGGALTPPTSPIVIAEGASGARVAGSPLGFRVVYQGVGTGDADGIFMKTVDAAGSVGAEVRVNAVTGGPQSEPDIAMLDDGRSAVVWASGGNVFVQRFGADGTAAQDDQRAPLNTTSGAGRTHPVIAASKGGGAFFAVAWETAGAGVSARFVGGSTGFGYNSVSGQNDEFVATHPFIMGERHNPAVAIGGAGFVVIGWEDVSVAHPGIYARRFPLPQGL